MKEVKLLKPADAQLSIIIPAFNSEHWIGPALERLDNALAKTIWKAVEIIVVDDGSTDLTSKAAKDANIRIPIKLIRQKNSGRLLARKRGIKDAKGDYILFMDSRVYTSPNSLKYLQDQMDKKPSANVWNGHIIIPRQGNPFARFWYTITFLAWHRYMKDPRRISYGLEDFDYYPKGTTGFFAPKKLLIEAYDNFQTYYQDSRNANDDTSLIRYIAKLSKIHMSPNYSFMYVARNTLRAFIPHTLHRGVVFIDGHFRKGGRYYYPALVYLLSVPIALILILLYPCALLLSIPALVLIFLFAKLRGAETADAAALAYIMPLFALIYTVGMYKGLLLRNSAK